MPKEKKVESTEVVSYVDSSYIVDLAKDESGLHFWEQNGLAPKRTLGSRPKQNLHLIPIKDKNSIIDEHVVNLPSKPQPYKNQQQLIEDIIEFIHKYLDCSAQWEPLLAHYYLMTWVYDRFSAVPYLRFLGDSGTGKTRKLEISHALSYKAIMASSATLSPLFRLMSQFRGTLILDEADWAKSEMTSEIVRMLNAGYKRRLPLLRSAKEGGDYEAKAFNVFGPKVIANRSRFQDDALENRCLTVQDPDRDVREDVPRIIPDCFDMEALELRNKLFQWRFDNYRTVSVNEEPLKKLPPRSCETGATIYSISTDENFKKWLIDFMSDKGDQARDESPKAQIAKIIIHKYETTKKIYFKDIIEVHNEGQDDCAHPLNGAKLRTYIDDLGLTRGKKTGYGNCVEPTIEEIERLKRKYD